MASPYKFIGKDGSMGLTNGVVYLLTLHQVSLAGDIVASMMHYEGEHSALWQCPYASWEKFKENWSTVDGQ